MAKQEEHVDERKVETFWKSVLTKNYLPVYVCETCTVFIPVVGDTVGTSVLHGRQNQMTFDTSFNKILCVLQIGNNLCIHGQPQPRSAIMICFSPWGGGSGD